MSHIYPFKAAGIPRDSDGCLHIWTSSGDYTTCPNHRGNLYLEHETGRDPCYSLDEDLYLDHESGRDPRVVASNWVICHSRCCLFKIVL